MEIKGAITALITPFKAGEIDEDSYRKHIEWQIEQGIDGLVPCGTTGESATLSHEEHKRVIKICVEQVKGRVPVIAGAGSNSTREAIELTKFAKDAGADAALLITPYYNKPTPDGLIAHYKEIAKEVSIPMVVYNVPSRTGLNITPAVAKRLFTEVKEIIGIKEASGNLRQVAEIIESCGKNFTVLSGDDFTILPLLSLGGKGVISVVSNIVPKLTHQLCEEFFKGNLEKASDIQIELLTLCRAMFIETNPIPVKTALALMGRIEMEVRLPLVEMQPQNKEKLIAVLKEKSLL
ncbi:4-hydroxy-tetrahydrodipicolinate synthase [Desulfonauticus submarinus]|uniref:4-hydroxy-tetrahydrodipicolinate synthase n=1 Tax=Desulfonauticus submarinus TaxID=206665 RepID=A0A1H0A725_9BACT|nr:4-hydroxy-tetrahydrodipicolinate synthase [Desulfonauticus submarinus]SDN29245.1 4-hydroxy-tetrahydrodipicolinate synthase [Desulfonauticus submarinus]